MPGKLVCSNTARQQTTVVCTGNTTCQILPALAA